MKALDRLHETYVYNRRIQCLSRLLSELVPPSCSLLDIGCGDGRLAESLLQKRPDLRLEGTDVKPREQTRLAITIYDGKTLPYGDASFDGVMLIDVLHHTDDPLGLLREAKRVSRTWLIIKDHIKQGFAAYLRLRFMDYVGNARHGVALPCNYLSAAEWSEIQRVLNLTVRGEVKELALYPWPANYVFGAGLHFIALLEHR